MTLITFTRTTSLLAALFFAGKATATAAAGGPGNSSLEDPLFLVGLMMQLLAVGALSVSLAGSRRLVVRVAAVVVGLVVFAACAAVVVAIIEALAPSEHWLWGEVNLWIGAAVVLGLAWRSTAASTAAQGSGGSTPGCDLETQERSSRHVAEPDGFR